MAHPDIEIVNELVLANQSAFQAVYHSTEKLKFKSLDSDGIRKAQKQLSYLLTEQSVPETLTPSIIQDFHFLSRCESVKQIHFPDSKELLDKARYRLKFEELFFLQLKLLRNHSIRNVTIKGAVFSKVGDIFTNFYNHYLPLSQANNMDNRATKVLPLPTSPCTNRLICLPEPISKRISFTTRF